MYINYQNHKYIYVEMEMNPTDKVGDIKAIGESASGLTSWIIDSIRG